MGPIIVLDIWKARDALAFPLNSNLSSVWLGSVSAAAEPAASYLLEFGEGFGPSECARRLLWSSPFKEALAPLGQAGPSTMPLGEAPGIGAVAAVLFACGSGPGQPAQLLQRARDAEAAISEVIEILDSGRFCGAKAVARLDPSQAVLSENQGNRLAQALALAEKARLGAGLGAAAGAPKPPKL